MVSPFVALLYYIFRNSLVVVKQNCLKINMVFHPKRIFRSPKLRLFLLLSAVGRAFVDIEWSFSAVSENVQNAASKAEETESNQCTIPILDPYDPSILSVLSNKSAKTCAKVQEDLFLVTEDGYIRHKMPHFQTFVLNKNNTGSVYCSLTDEYTGMVDDEKPIVSTSFPYRIQRDFAQVTCSNGAHVLYTDFFLNPLPSREHKFAKESDKGLSVLLLYLDGLSVSSYRRHLTQTARVITDLGFTFFDSLNRVGENTFPNVMPLLTGKRPYYEGENMPAEFDASGKLDGLHTLFDAYKERGYVTVFNEDNPSISLFKYGITGYSTPPTHYYYATFFDRIRHAREEGKYCVRNRMIFDIFLDTVALPYKKYRSERKLLFMFSSFTHDDEGKASRIDKKLADFFVKSHKNRMFERTVVFFMSDHGPRMNTQLRQTPVGFLEERLPFLTVYLPPALLKVHPNLKAAVEANAFSRRLVTAYDLHETLDDILNANFDGKQRPTHSRGQSLFYPIPKYRSCEEAGIPMFHCTCLQRPFTHADPAADDSVQAAKLAVTEINAALEEAVPNMCVKLNLNQILKVEKLENENLERKDMYYKIKLEMVENGAVVEAVVQRRKGEMSASVAAATRLDRYGNQSHCITHQTLRLFCICTDMLILRS